MEAMVRPRKNHFRTLVLDGGVATADIGAAVCQHQAADDLLNLGATAQAIAHAVWLSAALEQEAIEGVIDIMTRWILNQEIVRLVAACLILMTGPPPRQTLRLTRFPVATSA